MAGQVLKKRRLFNPGRRRNMSPKQIKYFGTKRQKAGLRNRRRNAKPYSSSPASRAAALRELYRSPPKRRRRSNQGLISSAERATERAVERVERAAESAIGAVTSRITNRGRRRSNVGEILTVIPGGNPGRRRNRKMATRRSNRRRARTTNGQFRRRRNRRRSNWARSHRRRSNPKVVVRYRNRHHRRHNRRRNQGGMLAGKAGAVVGILGGAAVAKLITGFLPANMRTGWTGYIATGLVAVLAGNMAGRMLKNRSLGNWVTIGGLLIVGLDLMGQFFPSVSLPFGLSTGTAGMGLITDSSFFVPQVNLPGSMARFVYPANLPAPVVIPASTSSSLGSMNQGLRRVGRLR